MNTISIHKEMIQFWQMNLNRKYENHTTWIEVITTKTVISEKIHGMPMSNLQDP